ncbi:alpha/beta hydrolase [Methylococcus geothermalis]|uniref:Alpha/beta fold hydrolase n=1 Tax=Methylococcus geothermalis TaxID=2681310 RepID=A0A858QAN2_9GAMM|nr:alpha/beta hydrolase [Methylococcus geothermalis]QJD30764.1 alpha/beta fold hydrolase [Methylococcus geothermalis]
MHRRFRFRSSHALVCLALLAMQTACAPLINRPGPEATVPRLHTAHFVAADGAVLPVRHWLPRAARPKAVIVALHGFNDYSHAFEPLGSYLEIRGIGCYAYDQRGFGLAPGRGLWAGVEAYARDLEAIVGQVRARHPGVPVYVLGESMGGAVAIVAMTSALPPRADGLILSAPAVWSRETMPWYQRSLLALSSHTVPWLRLTGEGLGVMASDNIEMLRGLGRDPNVIKATRVDAIHGLADLMDAAQERVAALRTPTLVLYGERDEIIPRPPVMALLGKLPPGTRFAYYRQGYHLLLRDLQADKPWRDIAAWVTAPSEPLPSGAERQAAEGFPAPDDT